jgi:ATP synthase protein I
MVATGAVGKVSLTSRFENLMEAEASLRELESAHLDDSTPDVILETQSPDSTDPAATDPAEGASSFITEDPSALTPEYAYFQHWLVLTTAGVGVVSTLAVALAYSPLVAGNYLLGVMGGVVYLRMLGRSVAQLGKTQSKLGLSRYAILIGLIVLAAKLPALQVLPIFFGFLSYKVTLLIHLFQTLFRPSRSRRS